MKDVIITIDDTCYICPICGKAFPTYDEIFNFVKDDCCGAMQIWCDNIKHVGFKINDADSFVLRVNTPLETLVNRLNNEKQR